MKNKHIVTIIPARGGSKGIPKKNIMSFCGKPLLAWSILQAKASKYADEVYVSSDSEEILRLSAKFGAKTIKRPRVLASDTASSEEAVAHALELIEREKNAKIDLAVFLQATSPLRTARDIDSSIENLSRQKADSLFSAALLEDFCIWSKAGGKLESFSFDYRNRGRRQDRPPLYLENGSIYVFKPEILRRYNNRLGGNIAVFFMPFWKSYEIDKEEDLGVAEYFMKKMILKKIS